MQINGWSMMKVYIKSFILEWTTSLDTSSRTLFVREGQCQDVHVTSNVVLRNNVRLLLNVELRNYVISRQIVERRVNVRLLFKYCGIIGLLVNIPITICITVIPPLPSPPLPSPPLPSPPLPSPPLPSPHSFFLHV